jgi:nucleotide-binding universal stress UspA family protein
LRGAIVIPRVLCSYDGSSEAEHVLSFAIEFAHRFAAELHVLGMVPADPGTSGSDTAEAELRNALERIQQRLSREAIGTRIALISADAVEATLRYAEDHRVDYIVIDSRRKNIGRDPTPACRRMSSVLDGSSCTVLITRAFRNNGPCTPT